MLANMLMLNFSDSKLALKARDLTLPSKHLQSQAFFKTHEHIEQGANKSAMRRETVLNCLMSQTT